MYVSNTAAKAAEKMGRKLKKQTMEALTHMKLRGRIQPRKKHNTQRA